MAHIPDPEILRNHVGQSAEDTPKNWIIKRSTVSGRGIFASTPIEKGAQIFTNKPLLVGLRADQNKNYCSYCYKICASYFICGKCTLLMCSEECKVSEEHTNECSLFVKYWKPKQDHVNDPKSVSSLSSLLIFLRSLLLTEEQLQLLYLLQNNKNPSNFDELETLCSKYEVNEDRIKFLKVVNTALKLNAYRVNKKIDDKSVLLSALYPLSSFLNHNCIPNTRIVIKKDLSMALYAARDINIGEEIFSCYTGLLWCTPARRCQLYKTKHFWCKCDRCRDPTEMGTKLSALKCLDNTCVGVLLPIGPLDPQADWQCDNCSTTVRAAQVSSVQSVLGSLVGTLDLDSQIQLEDRVLDRLTQFIPLTNHIFVDLRLRLAIKFGCSDGLKMNELPEGRLSLKERLCRGTLRTLAALGAGDAHLRGLLLYHLHAALAERARRSPHLYEDLKSEIESTIEQAFNILQGDIAAPPDLELRRNYLGPGCDKPHEERFFILDS